MDEFNKKKNEYLLLKYALKEIELNTRKTALSHYVNTGIIETVNRIAKSALEKIN